MQFSEVVQLGDEVWLAAASADATVLLAPVRPEEISLPPSSAAANAK